MKWTYGVPKDGKLEGEWRMFWLAIKHTNGAISVKMAEQVFYNNQWIFLEFPGDDDHFLIRESDLIKSIFAYIDITEPNPPKFK